MSVDARHDRAGRLMRAEAVAADVWLYTLALDAPLVFHAGPFVNVAVPGAAPRGERSYSVWSSPDDAARAEAPVVQLCVKRFPGGAASEMFGAAQLGDVWRLRGPFGVCRLQPGVDTCVFVATSTGLAPFHAMLRAIASGSLSPPSRIHLYFGVRSEADLFGVAELDALTAAVPGFTWSLHLSRPSAPGATAERVTTAVDRDHPTPNAHFWLCGNGAMIDEVRLMLKARGLDRRHIHVERYW